MTYPLSAIFAANAQDVPPGHFYLKEGNWYLAVCPGQSNGGGASAICLTGERTGTLQQLPDGSGIYIGGEFSIEPRVLDLSSSVISPDAYWNGALLVGERIHIFAQYGNADRLFTLDGQASTGGGISSNRRRFLQWEAWLVKANGPVSTTPLFTVQAIPKVGKVN